MGRKLKETRTGKSVSYCIPVCDEALELNTLLGDINTYVMDEDEIVIQCDEGNTTQDVLDVIKSFKLECNCDIIITSFPLNEDFASFKNQLKSKCSKDYIFQIDADEYLGEGLLTHLEVLIKDNPDIDLFMIPRINIVKNIDPEYIDSQRWRAEAIPFPITEIHNELVINWPDNQARLFKNQPYIKWVNKVHEVLKGYKTISYLYDAKNQYDTDYKQIQEWSLIHVKDAERQKRQNEHYLKINK